jgi:20S proteasome alpha/beta subunit
MAGYDEGVGPSLYWCDYLATLHHMNICGTGYGEPS